MAKPKSNNVYKVTCAATGKQYTVRPTVWEQRLKRFKVSSEVLAENYLGRDALKVIKSASFKKDALLDLQSKNTLPYKAIEDVIWKEYLNRAPKVDEDIETTIQVAQEETEQGVVETVETVEV